MSAVYFGNEKAPRTDTVVVFIHGILGSPSQFTYLVDALDGKYDTLNLLLPGHGGTIREFADANMRRWLDFVLERVRRLEESYGRIVLVGHSMGCLLAVCAALRRPEKLSGLFLISIPLVIRVRSLQVVRTMLSALDRTSEADQSGSENRRRFRPAVYICALPRFLELFSASKKARRLVGALTIPVVAVHAENDKAVSKKSLRWFDGMKNVRVLTAEDADHFHYSEETKKMLADTLLRFVGQAAGKKDAFET